ncbi:MAG: hypothetical protein H6622_05915 [Halobacteriovoraceae bacterium]|nr:hypothetical protein [Halobacteriovoraceae bacterium]
MKFKGGVSEAAKMLSGLAPNERNRVLSDIQKRDPRMAKLIKKNMITFEDLQYLTLSMLQELLREVNIDDLALSLRIGSVELRDFIFSKVSSRLKEDINSILKGAPMPVTKVQEARERIMEIVRRKVENGEIIINRGEDEYV